MRMIRFTNERQNRSIIVYVTLDRVVHATYDGSRTELTLTYMDHNDRKDFAYLKGDDAINVHRALDRAVFP